MALRQMRGNLSGLSGGFLNPVGILSSLGIASMILWCKLMGHTSGFFVPLAGLGAWANARVFWLVGILLAAVACFALPRALRSADATQRFVFPMIAVAGAMSFALAFYQDIFDQRTLAMLGLVVSGFGYFWFISRFVLLLALTQGIACLAWAFSCAFVLRQVLLIAMDALIPINHQVMVAIALPLSAIACLEGACLLGRRADARSAPPGADGQANMLWGIRTLPKERHIDARSGRYLIVILAAVALLLSVARACSISGTWGNDHTADLDLSVAIPLVVLYAALVFGLVYLGVIRTARLGDVPRFLVGVLVVMTGLLVAALRPALDPTPSVALDVFVNTNDPFALVFFWSTVGVAIQRLAVRPNRVIGLAGALYAAASIVWVFLINDANAVSSTFVLTAVYVLLALSIVVLQLKEGPGDAGRVAAAASGAAPVAGGRRRGRPGSRRAGGFGTVGHGSRAFGRRHGGRFGGGRRLRDQGALRRRRARARPVSARAGRALPDGAGKERELHPGGAGHRGEHGQDPHAAHLRQARRGRPPGAHGTAAGRALGFARIR